jgi:NAD(P)-dependent dehydrogenase (short-subunit alcohol dehydrogenase family)
VKDKTFLVTGGNIGIGLATAMLFAQEGANIAIISRRAEKNEEARALVQGVGANCIIFSADVAIESEIRDAVERTLDRFGSLHYAFNNAGVSQATVPITELTSDDYDHQFSVNTKGTFFGMKYQIPAIIRSGGGAICNNASAAGLVGSSHQALYGAAKFGVVGLTRSAALEFARQNVRVNAVCPGATTGDMHKRWAAENPEAAKNVGEMIPMGRIGLKEEVAKAVLFLCRDATYTTGLALTVDGGLTTG